MGCFHSIEPTTIAISLGTVHRVLVNAMQYMQTACAVSIAGTTLGVISLLYTVLCAKLMKIRA